MVYTQFTLDEKYIIYEQNHRGHSLTEIARQTGRCKSAIG